eukprot:gene7260-8069_t
MDVKQEIKHDREDIKLGDGDTQEAMIQKKISLAKRVLEQFKIIEKGRIGKKQVLLKSDEDEICVSWLEPTEYVFKVLNAEVLAEIWGMLKLNASMNYGKLTRALRYYYGKNLIEKVADRPYTYCFVQSDKTKDYLPAQAKEEEKSTTDTRLLNTKSDEVRNAITYQQRPKSVPGCIMHNERGQQSELRLEKSQDMVSSFFASVFRKSEQRQRPNSAVSDKDVNEVLLNNVDYHDRLSPVNFVKERYRTSSLPSRIRWVDQPMEDVCNGVVDGSGTSLILSGDDWEDKFLTRRSARQMKAPETSCFTAKDLPLLNFEDIRTLEKDICSDQSSTTCSYASPRSPKSITCSDVYEGCNIDMEEVERGFEHNLTSITTNHNHLHYTNHYPNVKTDVYMDVDSEMELVEEYISEHSSNSETNVKS